METPPYLEELHDGLQASVTDVAASEDEAVNARGPVREILDEVENVRIIGIQQANRIKAAQL